MSFLISPNQTVEIKVLKAENATQSIEVKIVVAASESPTTVEIVEILPNLEENSVGEAVEIIPQTPSQTEILSKPLNNSKLVTQQITTSIPNRRESLPQVIECKVLSPDEEINLSLLTNKTLIGLTLPKKRYKQDQNWITSEQIPEDESIYLDLSAVTQPTAAQKSPTNKEIEEQNQSIASEGTEVIENSEEVSTKDTKSLLPNQMPEKLTEPPTCLAGSAISPTKVDDTEFNPRLLLIRSKEEIKSTEPLVDPSLQSEPNGPDDIQCALCMGYTTKKAWMKHIRSHYGVGWIVGQPPPLNLHIRKSVRSYFHAFFKNPKIKGLKCRICGSYLRTGRGLFFHLERCCLTQEEISRVVCEYCTKDYTKASYLNHKRKCREYLKKIVEESKALETVVSTEGTSQSQEEVLSNTDRLKRKCVIN